VVSAGSTDRSISSACGTPPPAGEADGWTGAPAGADAATAAERGPSGPAPAPRAATVAGPRAAAAATAPTVTRMVRIGSGPRPGDTRPAPA